MYGQRPPGIDGEYQAPPQLQQPRGRPNNRWRNTGGAVVGAGLIGLKFKSFLLLLVSFKWIFLAGKFALSFSTIFVSIWFYALFYGWKLGVVFVLLILVHELGHWFVLRGFGVAVSLPYFIPGLGAFVAQKEMTPSAAHDAAAAIAGPVVGIAASALCQAYGMETGNMFWVVAAHIGYLLNLFNLIPALPFDGGRVAGAIDPRLWMLGVALFIAYVVFWWGLNHPIAWLFLLIVCATSIPRAIAAWRGTIDPRVLQMPPAMRGFIALAYFVTIAVGALGAIATQVRL
jgi:Zn-dependent protease